jgi:poly(A) polymerase
MDRLLAALEAGKGRTRFVGGCVRDTLLGMDASDVDLATSIAPEDVIRRLEKARIKAVPTGLAHGTVTAVIGGKPVEVTTLRRDVATDGRRATIAYTEDWREDAARRDFTINALSADPESGEVFDYFGGIGDLDARLVRFIGDPLQRIAEDHLRILRFFRFHARFARGAPDEAALAACAARANDLMALSRERIADELLKLLALPDPAPTVRLMIERGIFRPILPEIDTADRLALLPRRERAAGVAADPIRRLGALLPRGDQYSHGGWETASEIGARLRLSIAARTRLNCMVTHRVEIGDDPRLLAYQVGLPCAVDRMLLAKTLNGEEAAARIRALEGWQRPRLPVSGGDLISMGLEAGPLVSQTMQAIEQEWMRSGFSSDKAEVRAIARAHVDQALRSSQ